MPELLTGHHRTMHIPPPFDLRTGLVGYWTMDEVSGNRADSSGVGNTLTDNNTVTQGTAKRGTSSAQFASATDESLSHADSASLSLNGNSWTWWMWFYADTLVDTSVSTDSPRLMGKWADSTHKEIDVRIDNPGGSAAALKFAVYDGTSTQVGTVTALPTLAVTTWYFAVGWVDLSAGRIFVQVNNGPVASAALSGIPGDSTSALYLGWYEAGTAIDHSAHWNGRIDEVGISKRVYSAAERSRLYAGAAGVTWPLPVGQ